MSLNFHCTCSTYPRDGTESRGPEIKLPLGARAEITSCGSGSFLFTTALKIVDFKKSWLLKKFLKIVTILFLLLSQKSSFHCIFYNYPEPEPQFGFAAPWSRSRKNYHIFSSKTLLPRKAFPNLCWVEFFLPVHSES
jgi:hypothetical protein